MAILNAVRVCPAAPLSVCLKISSEALTLARHMTQPLQMVMVNMNRLLFFFLEMERFLRLSSLLSPDVPIQGFDMCRKI